MKRKTMLIITFIILILLGVINIYNKYNNTDKEMINVDGMMLAMTLDSQPITTFPARGMYKVDVECINAHGLWSVENWKLLVENIEGNVKCNIDFYTQENTISQTISGLSTGDGVYNEGTAGYRYEGINPKNYISFNGELWRIIGSIPTKLVSNGDTVNLVKIIRNHSLGTLEFGNSSSWQNSSLNALLNNHYYASTTANMNGQNSGYCYADSSTNSLGNCDYTHNGILSTSYYGQMVEKVYWNTGESNSNQTASEAYNTEIAEQNHGAYVGLISLSDYGYATSASKITMSSYTTTQKNVNWFVYPKFWLLTKKGNRVVFINTGETIADYDPTSGTDVMPVVYLKSDVFISSGDGTINNPYQVALLESI